MPRDSEGVTIFYHRRNTMPQEANQERTEELAGKVLSYLGGSMKIALIWIGEHLGIYRKMQGAGKLTSNALADQMGLSERWVREWLHGQAAAGYIDYRGDGLFELSAESAAVLSDESSPFFLAGGLCHTPQLFGDVLARIPEAFRSGLGLSYDEMGPELARGVERLLAPWYRHALVPVALPALDGVLPKLESGANVADVGCGAGVVLVQMAQAYPNSEFHGSDMAHPTQAIRAIRQAIKPDGTWFIADIHCGASLEENLAEASPLLPMLYGFSVLCCMSSSLSTPDGEGLGTVGFGEATAQQMTSEAGLSQFQRHDFDNPLNSYYEVRI
jgi:hypothetical protein